LGFSGVNRELAVVSWQYAVMSVQRKAQSEQFDTVNLLMISCQPNNLIEYFEEKS